VVWMEGDSPSRLRVNKVSDAIWVGKSQRPQVQNRHLGHPATHQELTLKAQVSRKTVSRRNLKC
jgi:hypothetical protein